METLATSLPGLLLVKPRCYRDDRGFFFESWQKEKYQSQRIPERSWAQDNVSSSKKGVLRGLHFQVPNSQGKLVTLLQGEIFDVAVDLRWGSPTFGKHLSFHLSVEDLTQIWIPEGFAHGFLVLSDVAIVSYKASEPYSPKDEKTLLWNDPSLSISWPKLEQPLVISEKDQAGKFLKDFASAELYPYQQ